MRRLPFTILFITSINLSNRLFRARTKGVLKIKKKNLQNDAILINHESFFQKKESSHLYRSQFFEINSLVAKIIKKSIFQNKNLITKLLNLLII